MVSLAGKIEFQTLCRVFEDIMKARGNKKAQVLQNFIQQCRDIGQKLKEHDTSADISMFPIMRLLLVKLDRERGAHGLKEKTLGNLYIRIFCLGKNTTDAEKIRDYREPTECQRKINDFAETLYWILKPRLETSSTMTIEQVNCILDKIAEKNAINEKKNSEFINLMQLCNGLAIKWITRLILKDIKLGLGEQTILKAYHPDAARLYGEISNLRKVCDTTMDLNFRLQQNVSNITVLLPFKPMLLERLSISDINKLFLDKNQSYIVQTKFDGERSQLHMKNGKFKYYSRHGYDITNHGGYGESKYSSTDCFTNKISSLINPTCQSIIIDGELMGWHKEKCIFGSKGMTFDVKKLSAKSNFQPCFVAFDIIYYNDKLLLDVPLIDRLNILENAFEERKGVLVRSENIKITSSEELLEEFNKSLDNNEEGIVVKRIDGIYLPNTRQNSNCYKLKAEYSDGLIEDIDMIIIGGYYGEGKYTGLFNSFLMGVASRKKNDDTDDNIEFYSIVSVSSGLTIDEMRKLNSRLKPYWTKECPNIIKKPKKEQPNYWIHPKNSIILQLRATEMTRCNNQPANYTLRFPRVVKIREDKPWYDACTIDDIRSFVKSPDVVQKLTKRHATNDDIVLNAVTKKCRRRLLGSMNITKIDDKYFGIKSSNIPHYSRLFEGKEFCVINGEEKLISKQNKLTKPDIEQILLTHSAKIVQNPSQNTYCIIVGNPETAITQNLISCKKYDIATVDWLRRATQEDNWSNIVDWYPWELLSFRPATIEKLYEYYDEYYDSFVDNADNETLIRSLNRVKMLNDELHTSTNDYLKLEKKLFKNNSSGGFSIFRNIIGYFVDPLDESKFAFQFMRGIINDEIDNSVTHIFVNDDCMKDYVDLYAKINICGGALIKVVKNQWINECFEKNYLLPITNFIVT
ncbi:hypothetical protein PV327_009628 [Microctonus hyperodae]|uniref:DNA ligase 4 n=1 Tax=Microctonus hyperodae TaxID=165561 RepID=A0AA39F196_MICHY|nr:hypothetical protein PV327_009628 [Microctonus hyperodae]